MQSTGVLSVNPTTIFKKFVMTNDLEDAENVRKTFLMVGNGFAYFTGVLMECYLSGCTDKTFRDLRGDVYLDTYVYFKVLAPLIDKVMDFSRKIFD